MNEEEKQEKNEVAPEVEPKAVDPVEAAAKKVGGLGDLPPLEKKTFRFERAGQRYEIEYTPLTYDQIEEVRAAMLPPKPPMRKIAGLESLKGKELAQRIMMGLPTYEPDEDDPAYRAAMVKYNNDLKLEQVRRAVGWAIEREEFLSEIRRKLYPGEIQSLMDEVDSTAWNINSSLVDRFFENLSQGTATEEN